MMQHHQQVQRSSSPSSARKSVDGEQKEHSRIVRGSSGRCAR